MRTFKGKLSKGINFYKLLYENAEFTIELGKMTLSCSKLEAEIILFFKRKNITKNFSKTTLNPLIDYAEKNEFFDENLLIILREFAVKRNYLNHNIYGLFLELIDETILERENILDSDVLYFKDKVYVLNENLNHIAEQISRM